MIGIVDYEAGNAQSVKHAVDALGLESCFVDSPETLSTVSRIILPGVGSADATIRSLSELKLVDALKEAVLNKRLPFLGICVGQQVLFEHSDEGNVNCFAWIKGSVKKFDDSLVRVPQIGWNQVQFSNPDHPLLEGLMSNFFYFVNSYYVVPDNAKDTFGYTQHQLSFAATVLKDTIFATQFHVEKSGPAGLKLLENFSKWTP